MDTSSVSRKKFVFCLWKAYFERGYGLTGYLKYLIAFFGVSTLNVKITLIIGILYIPFCFLIGYLWFYYRLPEAETEVGNHFNLFVKEMRDQMNKNA